MTTESSFAGPSATPPRSIKMIHWITPQPLNPLPTLWGKGTPIPWITPQPLNPLPTLWGKGTPIPWITPQPLNPLPTLKVGRGRHHPRVLREPGWQLHWTPGSCSDGF